MDRRSFLTTAASVALTPALASAQAPAPSKLWPEFARRFVAPDGRVIDTGNQGITHTEGLGAALLAAQADNDRDGFKKTWSFAQQLKRPDGLYSWKWVPGVGIPDKNNATDGDLYIAWALLRAGSKWSDKALLGAAADLARSIRQELLVRAPQGAMLLPGKEGFITRNPMGVDRVVANPAYWVFPALRELNAVDPSPVWAQLHADALKVLEYARFGPAELPADWLVLDDPVMPWQAHPARFGYEAIRVPLFLAWDRKFTHGALRACAQHMRQPKFPAWVSLKDAEKAPYAAPSGFEAVARLARKAVYGEPLQATQLEGDYFSCSLTLLASLAAKDLGWA